MSGQEEFELVCSVSVKADTPEALAKGADALARWAAGWAAEGASRATIEASGHTDDGAAYWYTAELGRAHTLDDGEPPARLPRPAG